jgi:hypothetical protein
MNGQTRQHEIKPTGKGFEGRERETSEVQHFRHLLYTVNGQDLRRGQHVVVQLFSDSLQ